MKTVNRICQVLAVVFGLAALVLFFTNFATITSASAGDVKLVGTQLAFGGKVEVAGKELAMAKSADILFCFVLSILSVVLSVLAFKSKKVRIAAPLFALGTAIYMLVITLSSPWNFVDTRPLPSVTAVAYGTSVLLTTIALFVFAIFAAAYLLIDDYIEVKEGKAKYTLLQRVGRFFRDYKSEVKKIVWPGWREVVKNTGIVLIMCALVGILIWGFDYGLGKLLEWILNV